MTKKQTKIVCTLGPSSDSKEIITKMVQAGMNVCRLNFSHGSYESHTQIIDNIKAVRDALKIPVTIMADLQGPRIRTGILPEAGLDVNPGDEITLTTATDKYEDRKIPVTYAELHEEVKPGERILINDALVGLKVDHLEGHNVICEVFQGGKITTHRGMNLPDSLISISTITEKDKEDLKFAIEHDVDFVALSFVAQAKDILDLKYLIKSMIPPEKEHSYDRAPIRIVAKIERKAALDNIEEIIEAADAIMVARGDLGIELPPEDVPLYQKRLIDLCLAAAKPVITATQMLDSMTYNPRPTRAEVSDVANAVIDHTDAIMLSGESATGKYPVETVETMSKIALKTEASTYDDLVLQNMLKKLPVDTAISQISNMLASSVGARIILVASMSGYTARVVCRYRPELPIFAATDNERVHRQLNLSWGVCPFLLPTCHSVEELIDRSLAYLKKEKEVEAEDRMIIIAGEPVGQPGVNLVAIREIK